MLCVGVAVGVSRSGLGPGAILASRYITLTIPMLCALYVAWLLYARGPARAAVHLGLLALMGLAFPAGHRFSREYGSHVRAVEIRVEHCLRSHAPTSVLMSRACPSLFPDIRSTRIFRMLRAAGVGAFNEFDEDRVASTPEASSPLRRDPASAIPHGCGGRTMEVPRRAAGPHAIGPRPRPGRDGRSPGAPGWR